MEKSCKKLRACPAKLKRSGGFTLIEIMVGIGILLGILSIGLFVSMDFFKGYSFRSEKSIIVSGLLSARSQSLNNINQVRHGIHLEASPLKYILFECPISTPECTSYTAGATDLVLSSSYKVSITAPSLPADIIFEQLSGECVNCSSPISIQINDGVKTETVTVGSIGRIDW